MEYVPIRDIIHVLKLGLLAILELFLMSQGASTLQHHVLRFSDSASEDRCINLLLSYILYEKVSFLLFQGNIPGYGSTGCYH